MLRFSTVIVTFSAMGSMLSAFAQSGVQEYQTCTGAVQNVDTSIFACSRVIADTSLPVDIRSQVLAKRGYAYNAKALNGRDASIAKTMYENAIADFSAALKLNSKEADSFYFRGISYQAIGEVDRAIADYSEAIKRNPTGSIMSYVNRAQLYTGKGQYDRALADANELISLKPKHHNAHVTRALIYKALGDKGRAIADFRTALEAEPPNAPFRSAIANELKELGVDP